jgi:hypothetical protein
MDAKSLVERLKSRGLSLYLEGAQIKLEAAQEPDSETKALVDELRQHREEVKIVLAPPLTAVKITPDITEGDIWLALNPGFKPDDDSPVFTPEEIAALKEAPAWHVATAYRVKQVMPSSRVLSEEEARLMKEDAEGQSREEVTTEDKAA